MTIPSNRPSWTTWSNARSKGLQKSWGKNPNVRYQTYLTAGVKRWQEYRNQLAPLKRKQVLFVMMNSTKDADEVADYLRAKYPAEFSGDRLHVIHTNRIGDVSTREEEGGPIEVRPVVELKR